MKKLIEFYKTLLSEINFDLFKIDEANFGNYYFDKDVTNFIDGTKKILLKFESIKSDFDAFVNANTVSECAKNFNMLSFSFFGSACTDESICYSTIIKKVVLGVTERIFYYKDKLIQYINMYPIVHFKISNNDRIFLNNMFLDGYFVIDKLLFNIWAITKNKEIYKRNLEKLNSTSKTCLSGQMNAKQESLINSYLSMPKQYQKEVELFQRHADQCDQFKNLSLFKTNNFGTCLRNNFVHNEITYNQIFNEIQLGHNVSFFDTIFVYYTSRLIYGAIELLNLCISYTNTTHK